VWVQPLASRHLPEFHWTGLLTRSFAPLPFGLFRLRVRIRHHEGDDRASDIASSSHSDIVPLVIRSHKAGTTGLLVSVVIANRLSELLVTVELVSYDGVRAPFPLRPALGTGRRRA